MIPKRIFLLLGAAAIALAANADVLNSPSPDGYLDRARLLAADPVYQGVIDQSLNAAPSESRAWLRAEAADRLHSPEARTLLLYFLDKYPASPLRHVARLDLADIRIADGKYPEALAELLALDPASFDDANRDDLYLRRAFCRLMLGDFDAAEADLANVTPTPANLPPLNFYNGYIQYVRGNYDNAVNLFRRLDSSRSPGDAVPYFLMEIAFAKGDYASSLADARRLLRSGRVDAYKPECNRVAGESLFATGDISAAAPYLWNYAAEVENPAPSAFYILGIDEYNNGRDNEAVKLLQKAVPAGGALGQSAYLYLGLAYLRRGDNDNAVMAFNRAYQQSFDDDVRQTAFYNYAIAQLKGSRVPFGSSSQILEDFLREYPRSQYATKVAEYLVNGYMRDNDYNAALNAINRLPNPDRSILASKQRVLFVLGTRQYQAGRIAEAEQSLRQVINLGDTYDTSILNQSRLWLADCLYSRGDYNGAIDLYRTYLAKAPLSDAANRAIANYDLAYALFSEGRYADAAPVFEAAAQSLPADAQPALKADIANRIGDCRYYRSDFANAQAAYNRAFELDPASGDYALFQLAVVKGMQGNHAAKVADIDNLLQRFPSTSLAPQAILEKAESLLALNKTDDAIAAYRLLVVEYAETPAARNGYLQLALTYLNAGRRDEAIEAYKNVIVAYPTSDEARLAADDLKAIYAAQGRLAEFANFINNVPDAPRFDDSQLESAAFNAAESRYAADGDTALLDAYVSQYPHGAEIPRALYYLGEAHWNAGNAAKALEFASQIVDRYPHSEAVTDALLLKADAESSLGKDRSALETYRRLEASASDASSVDAARLGILRTATRLALYDDVINAADALLASTASSGASQTRSEALFYRAVALDRQGRHADADAALRDLARNPADIFGSMAAVEYGQSLLNRGKTDLARQVVDDFINANPPHQYWLARGFILYSDILRRQGNSFEADEYLRSLKQNYPGSEPDITSMINARLS